MAILDKINIIERKKISDTRGVFLKLINGFEDGLPSYTGEFYITIAYPNESKGGHYHKEAKEWFTLVKGKCILKLVDMETNEEVSINLSWDQPQTIMVPPNIAHIFINNGNEDYILTAYSDKLYVPEDTIMYNF